MKAHKVCACIYCSHMAAADVHDGCDVLKYEEYSVKIFHCLCIGCQMPENVGRCALV